MLGQKGIIPEDIKIVCPSAPFIPTKGLTGVMKDIVDALHPEKEQVHSWIDYEDTKKTDKQFTRLWGLLDREVGLLDGDSSKVFVVGHSQGADIAMRIGLMYKKTLGGICGLQGGFKSPQWKRPNANKETPVMFLMGSKDDIAKPDTIEEHMKTNCPYKMFKRKNFTWVVLPIDNRWTKIQFDRINKWMS